MNNIDVKQLMEKIISKENIVVLDVRSRVQYNEDHIKGAINIPMSNLAIEADNLDIDKEIVVYCNSGKVSIGATLFLLDKGFNVKNLKGGFEVYKKITN
ncbi:rhodanese-like domain-containing protein [Clostridium sp. ATCC 25772]|uniref:rhodanese-like domain-containing protein n=1 Tax=Clostridium sp. ATCC 25772 TaxID=1676991 RepID=UPI00078620AB|nr:rhodanese-like domain-containing protein [Clostridium sp. ATCC 25772]